MQRRRRFTFLKVYLWTCPGCAFRNATATRARGRSMVVCRACTQAFWGELHGQTELTVTA